MWFWFPIECEPEHWYGLGGCRRWSRQMPERISRLPGGVPSMTRVDSSSSQHVTTHMPIICHDAIFGAQRANCTLNTQVPWQEWIAVSAGSYRYADNMPQITMPYLEPNYTIIYNYLGAGHWTGMDLNLLLHSSPLESSGSRTFDYWGHHQGATLLRSVFKLCKFGCIQLKSCFVQLQYAICNFQYACPLPIFWIKYLIWSKIC